jgi:hypothetical protein
VHLAQCRVERGEQLVDRESARAGQPIEEGGLARVGVADERHRANRRAPARAALHGTAARHARHARAQQLHALPDEAAVRFELGFARSAQADAALLALEVGPAAGQAGGKMRELGELHLQLAFGAARAQREDVENEARAVDHAALELFLEVALLHAGQRVVEDHEIGRGLAASGVDLVDLAFACEERGVGARAPSRDRADDERACGHGELGELLPAIVAAVVAEVEHDEQGAIAPRGTLKHRRASSAANQASLS